MVAYSLLAPAYVTTVTGAIEEVKLNPSNHVIDSVTQLWLEFTPTH